MGDIVSASEVRDFLKLDSVELPDSVLDNPANIPSAEAFFLTILTNNGKTFDDLSTHEQTLLKSAVIFYVSASVAVSIPEGDFASGPIEIDGVSAADVSTFSSLLESKYLKVLKTLRLTISPLHISSSGYGVKRFKGA